jgi:hypothetical protein
MNPSPLGPSFTGTLTVTYGMLEMEKLMKTELPSGWSGTTTLESSRGGYQKVLDQLVESTLDPTKARAYMPLVSVLCTSKGAQFDHIQQCCDSLSRQQQFHFELIVCCRSMTDLNLWNAALEDFTFKHHVYLGFGTHNRSEAFKSAFETCRSPWCFVLDADDMLQENAIPYAHWVLERFPQFRVFCSDHAQTDEHGEVFEITKYDPHEQRPESMSIQFKQRHLWGFNRELIRQYPNLLDSPYFCEDAWFFSRLCMNSEPVLHIPKTLYFWRRHALQLTRVLAEDAQRMCKAIQIEVHRWMSGRPIGSNMADELMAERIKRTADNLLR